MILKEKQIYLYGIFLLMFLWDVIDEIYPNIQFVAILGLFLLYLCNGNRLKITKEIKMLVVLATVIALHGIANVMLGNDKINLLVIQAGAIAVCYISFSTLIRKCSISEIFNVYWKVALAMALFGLVEVFLGLLNVSNVPLFFTFTKPWYCVLGVVKLAALCREPSFLGYFLAPAVYLVLSNILSPETIDKSFAPLRKKWQGICICSAYLLTFSGVAYFGAFIMLVVIWWKKGVSLWKIMIPIVILITVTMAYTYVPDIHVRVDDTVAVFLGDSSGGLVNLSSYTYYANYSVVKQSFINNYGLGSGLGSYQVMFDKYNIGAWGDSALALNREDANSAFFRILTELGVVGIVAAMWFLFRFMPKKKNTLTCYSSAIFCLFVMFLLRQGNYTHGCSVLFICMYIKIWRESQLIDKGSLIYEK